MSIRPDMQPLAEELGASAPAIEPGTAKDVPIRWSLYLYYLDIAKRERTSIAAVINDVLRTNIEGQG
jgi:hypothetical protein